MRTVIVDDDGLVAISLKTILEAQGIEVAATGNDGKEAIELSSGRIADGYPDERDERFRGSGTDPYRRCRGEDFIFDNVFG